MLGKDTQMPKTLICKCTLKTLKRNQRIVLKGTHQPSVGTGTRFTKQMGDRPLCDRSTLNTASSM